MNYVAKAALNNSIQSVKSSMTPQSGPKINWEDFNYPPLLKVIHYDITEVPAEKRLTVRFMWLSHVLIFVEGILNLINSIAIVASAGQGIRILYSVMFLFSFVPLAAFVFYRGYKGLCEDAFLLTLYKWVQILLIILWSVFAIVNFLSFNGFIAIGPLFDGGMAFQGVLAIVECIVFLVVALMSSFALFKVFTAK